MMEMRARCERLEAKIDGLPIYEVGHDEDEAPGESDSAGDADHGVSRDAGVGHWSDSIPVCDCEWLRALLKEKASLMDEAANSLGFVIAEVDLSDEAEQQIRIDVHVAGNVLRRFELKDQVVN